MDGLSVAAAVAALIMMGYGFALRNGFQGLGFVVLMATALAFFATRYGAMQHRQSEETGAPEAHIIGEQPRTRGYDRAA